MGVGSPPQLAMSSSLIRRSAWVDPKYPVTGPASNLALVTAIAIHYPGVNPGALNLNDPVGVLRATNRYYLSKTPPYSIGYSFATFPSGRFELRGFDIRNAANAATNATTLSINVMVNGQDEATPDQVQWTRDMVDDIWAHLGRRVPLIAHGDLSGAATQCPGAGIRRQLAAGLFLPVAAPKPNPPEVIVPPTPPGDDDMAIPTPITHSEVYEGSPARWHFWFMTDEGHRRPATAVELDVVYADANLRAKAKPLSNEHLWQIPLDA